MEQRCAETSGSIGSIPPKQSKRSCAGEVRSSARFDRCRGGSHYGVHHVRPVDPNAPVPAPRALAPSDAPGSDPRARGGKRPGWRARRRHGRSRSDPPASGASRPGAGGGARPRDRALRVDALAQRGAVPRRAGRGRGRGARRQAHLLYGNGRRRRVEDLRWRDQLGPHHGRLRRLLLRRSRGRLRVGSQRRLCRDGRALHPRRDDFPRRRRLPLDGCGPHLDAHGPRPHPHDLPHSDPSGEPGSRLRRRPGIALRAHAGARHLSFGRRRGELGTRPPRGREHGGLGPRDGPHEPAHPLRLHVGPRPRSVVHPQRRARLRLLEVDGRRGHVGGDQRGTPRSHGEDGDRRLPRGRGPRVGAGRGG